MFVASASNETRDLRPAAPAALEKARYLASRRDYAQAADEFSKAAGAGAGWQALSGQALCLYKMGRLSQALEAASAAVACAPSLPQPHFTCGLVRAEAGLHDDAVDSYNSAERLGLSPFAVCYHRAAANALGLTYDQFRHYYRKFDLKAQT